MEVSAKPSLGPDFCKLASRAPVLKLRPDLGKEQTKRHKSRGLPAKDGVKKGQGYTEGRKQGSATELQRACDVEAGEGDSGLQLQDSGDEVMRDSVGDATRVMQDLERVLRKDGVIRPRESLSPAEVLDRAHQYIQVLVEMEREDRNNHFG